MKNKHRLLILFLLGIFSSNSFAAFPANPIAKINDGNVAINGELKQWHKVVLELIGPFAKEADTNPNPFLDYNMTVTFTHESGQPSYKVPAYFAADGNAANTSATEGTIWRAVLMPDKPGKWNYTISFLKGEKVSVGECANPQTIEPYNGKTGSFTIGLTDKKGIDLRAKGRLSYVGKRYLQWSGTGDYFLKTGADAPETLLGYKDFDNTIGLRPSVPLKSWAPHIKDWKEGDPTWQNGKGKGLIGAINYLSSKGMNSFSFLTYNAGGDGDNVWPFTDRDDKFHYDCSKLDQWQIVFDHAQKIGMYLSFKLQENENDDNLDGHQAIPKIIKESLDGGETGVERKLYLREIIARFGYELALHWNLGEETTQSTAQIVAMAAYMKVIDPFQHVRVVHTFPEQQDKVYLPLLGSLSEVTGVALQNPYFDVHRLTLKWITESDNAGKAWVVANDEQGGAAGGVPQDIGYKGTDGLGEFRGKNYDLNDIRKVTLWGNLMAGGAGVEYYFGYKLPENDLKAEDYRSRDKSWEYANIATQFFKNNKIPFWQMKNADELIDNPKHTNDRYCFAKKGEIYLVYLPNGGTSDIDLSQIKGNYSVQWFNPRIGDSLQTSAVKKIKAGVKVNIGNPPTDDAQDWLAVIKKLN